ncbi:MAG: hypothetical protein DMG22_16810 [Acidobacteria bacterium]|nr:MAG: hypothetical protein DMG22_16810 [Acidobacteriota bacterium]
MAVGFEILLAEDSANDVELALDMLRGLMGLPRHPSTACSLLPLSLPSGRRPFRPSSPKVRFLNGSIGPPKTAERFKSPIQPAD